jgi:hypothetical protein
MRATFRHSSAPRSSRRLSIFPSRPDLKAATRSFRRRRKSLTVHGRGRLLAYVQLAAWRESLLRLRRSYPRSYLCRSSGAPHPAYGRCLRPALYSSLRSSPSHPTGVSALRVTIAIANARKQWGLRKSTAKSRRLFRNESATSRRVRAGAIGGSTAMTRTACCRKSPRVARVCWLGSWALGISDRGGQDKSRKVRTVGLVGNSAKFTIMPNIMNVSRNLHFLIMRYWRSTFDTLRRDR